MAHTEPDVADRLRERLNAPPSLPLHLVGGRRKCDACGQPLGPGEVGRYRHVECRPPLTVAEVRRRVQAAREGAA